MDHRLMESFAGNYPTSSQQPKKAVRTPLNEILSRELPPEKYYSYSSPPSHKDNSKSKKLFVIIAIGLLGCFIYSAYAYTISDHIFGTINVELFDPNHGQPNLIIQIIHTVIFMILIWLVLKIAG